MATPINMPQVGQDLTEGQIIEWKVKEGDTVRKGDVVVVVESEKAVFEVEAYEAGTVLSILVPAGEWGKVLQPIAWIGEKGESLKSETEAKDAAQASADEQPKKNISATSPETGGGTRKESPDKKQEVLDFDREEDVCKRRASSPSARRTARELGIDLSTLSGSGPNGRIIKKDVLSTAAAAAAGTTEVQKPFAVNAEVAECDTVKPFNKMRQKIAERLTSAKQTIPHFYLFIDVDMSVPLAWRTAFNAARTDKISVNDILIKAVAVALRFHPSLNAHVYGDQVILRDNIHLGVAVSTENGLLVPVVSNADTLDIQSIHRVVKELAAGAHRGILKLQDPGTLTISNLGMYGISSFIPIINPPEVAILAVGTVEKRVVATLDDTIGIRPMMTLTLACDHRAVDGSAGAEFLKTLKTTLENFSI